MLNGPRKRRHLNGDVSYVSNPLNPSATAGAITSNQDTLRSAAINIPANMNVARIQSIADKNAELNQQMMEKAAQQREEIMRYNQSLMNNLTPEEIEEIKRRNGYYR